MQRLQKFLASAGLGSRRKSEEIIKQGRVRLNDSQAKLGDKVGELDKVYVDGNLIESIAQPTRIIMLNKQRGVICSKNPQKFGATIFDNLPDPSTNWISIGRLDVNTTGLLLITNNGELAHKLMHPSSIIDREYLVRARGSFTEKIKESMLKGININDKKLQLTDIVPGVKQSSNQWFTVCLQSGKNREVRNLFDYHGLQVSRLKRVRFGSIFLDKDLKEGQLKELTLNEVDQIIENGI